LGNVLSTHGVDLLSCAGWGLSTHGVDLLDCAGWLVVSTHGVDLLACAGWGLSTHGVDLLDCAGWLVVSTHGVDLRGRVWRGSSRSTPCVDGLSHEHWPVSRLFPTGRRVVRQCKDDRANRSLSPWQAPDSATVATPAREMSIP
jgi:hypothetical protein